MCDTCHGTRTKNSTGMCVCNASYYDDGLNAACPSCDYSCKTCTTATSCSQCDAVNKRTFDLSQGSKCVCMAKYYDQGLSDPACLSCDATCGNCTSGGPTDCISCNTSAYRIFNLMNINAGNGSCDCMPGYFSSGPSTELCSVCNYKCATCTGTPACVTCDISKYR